MFRILALETSELTGSVAAAADGKVLAELQLDPQQRSAQSLGPGDQVAPGASRLAATRNSTAGGDHRSRIVYGPSRGGGDGEGLCLRGRGRGLGNWHPGGHRRRRTQMRLRQSRWPLTPSAATWSRSGFAAAERVPGAGWKPVGDPALVPLEEWLARLPPGFAVSGPVLKKWAGPLPRGRYDARSGVLASHGRQCGPAGLSRLSGRPPRRSLELAARLLAAQCGGREVGEEVIYICEAVINPIHIVHPMFRHVFPGACGIHPENWIYCDVPPAGQRNRARIPDWRH